MFGAVNVFDDIFNFHRETQKLFRDTWRDAPWWPHPAAYPINVEASSDGWRIKVAMPGIDPKDVSVDVAGITLSIRAEHAGGQRDGESQYSQTITLPQFLDLDRITASHRHGLLELTVPLKDSVRPRRVQIDGVESGRQKQLTTA
jgi:HSP20 family protein